MSKPIRSYPKAQRIEVVKRRLTQAVKGLGYWAAVDAKRRIKEGKEV